LLENGLICIPSRPGQASTNALLLGLGYGPQIETRQVEAALQELVKTTREWFPKKMLLYSGKTKRRKKRIHEDARFVYWGPHVIGKKY
jgi:hypothetical protein